MQHKHLGETVSFKCALWIPLAIGTILWLLITYSEGHMSLCFEASCVQTFFTIYKFPIAIAGASLPLVAMVAALQRSEEAAIQLREAQLNNRFGNYLKHREGFDSLINNYCERSNVAVLRTFQCEPHSLYIKLFPESGFNNPLWLGSFDREVIEEYDAMAIRLLAEMDKEDSDFNINEFMDALRDLKLAMTIAYSQYKRVYYTNGSGESKHFTVPALIDERFCLIICLADTFEIYRLLKHYANHGTDSDFGELILQSGITGKIKSSIFSIEFKVPPSWQNTDVPAIQ